MKRRIGCVPYLNARPLIYGLEDEILFEHPVPLAESLHRGRVEIALVPVAEIFEHPGYRILDGPCIGSHGEVKSVFLAHQKPLDQLERVAVDFRSKTSALLVRVLLEQFAGLTPHFAAYEEGREYGPETGVMLIGDQALAFAFSNTTHQLYDLGSAWKQYTGLPFVYAVWAMPPHFDDEKTFLKLRRAWQDGWAHREQIVAADQRFTADFRRRYLTESIRYDLNEDAKKGLALFYRKTCEMTGTAAESGVFNSYV
ncbi:MAG: menaquinone biosynthesis protein [Verrucomicrobiae bacterium]|nr:menaquinone biosynthesis protein [Verrucomicrobiae bacterium]